MKKKKVSKLCKKRNYHKFDETKSQQHEISVQKPFIEINSIYDEIV